MKIILCFFLIASFSVACIRKDTNPYQWKISVENNSQHIVEYTIFGAYFYSKVDTSFNLSATKTISFEIYSHIFGSIEDSATITFDNVKRITFRKNDGNPRNILDLKNYTGGETGEHYFEYLYKITEEDYANAIPIK
jgi:hypothetical protein